MTRAPLKSKPDHPVITLVSIKLLLGGCSSLKEKRSQLQPLLSRLRKEFNIAVAETGLQDYWQSAWISCVIVSNDAQHNTRVTNEIVDFIASRYSEIEIDEHHSENR